jgi:hypothetical protein
VTTASVDRRKYLLIKMFNDSKERDGGAALSFEL